MLAHRISFSVSQKGFLAFDGCAEHNFVCIAALSKVGMQHLLDRCSDFTEWAHLMFNTKKCASLFMVNCVSPIIVDLLFTPLLKGDAIPALTWDRRYKYLGCPTGAHHHNNLSDLGSLYATLVKDSTTVFKSPLAEWQKLDAFRRFLFPRVSFVLKVMFPGSTSCHKQDTTLRGSSREASRSHLEPARNISIFPRILEEWAFLCRGRGSNSQSDTGLHVPCRPTGSYHQGCCTTPAGSDHVQKG